MCNCNYHRRLTYDCLRNCTHMNCCGDGDDDDRNVDDDLVCRSQKEQLYRDMVAVALAVIELHNRSRMDAVVD